MCSRRTTISLLKGSSRTLAATRLRPPCGSSARSAVGKPLGHDGGLCKSSRSVVVSTAAVLGRLFERCSVEKESHKSKRVVAWGQLRGSAGSRDFRIRSKGQFKRRQQAFRKYKHALCVCTNLIPQSAMCTAARYCMVPCARNHRIVGYLNFSKI